MRRENSPPVAAAAARGTRESDEFRRKLALIERPVRGLLRQYRVNDADIDDLFQETCLRLDRSGAFSDPTVHSLVVLALWHARWVALDWKRKQPAPLTDLGMEGSDSLPKQDCRLDGKALLDELSHPSVDKALEQIGLSAGTALIEEQSYPSAENALIAEQTLSRISVALSKLPVHRRVFTLFKVYGYKGAEIAARLNMDERKVRSYLETAVRHVDRAMRQCRVLHEEPTPPEEENGQ